MADQFERTGFDALFGDPQTESTQAQQPQEFDVFREPASSHPRGIWGELFPTEADVFRPEYERQISILGRSMPVKEIKKYDGGDELLRLTELNEQGRRGFRESITDWRKIPGELPFIGETIGSVIPIKEMRRVAETFEKINDQRWDEITEQDMIYAQLYVADQERQGMTTIPGQIGDALRAMPSFMITYRGFLGAARWLGPKLLAGGARGAVAGSVSPDPVTTAIGAAVGLAKPIVTAGRAVARATLGKAANQAAVEGAKRFLASSIGSKYARRLGKEAIKAHLVGTGIQALDAPTVAIANIAKGQDPLTRRSAEDMLIQASMAGEDLSVRAAQMYALGDRWVEYLSESSGPMLGALVGIDPATHLGDQWISNVFRRTFGKQLPKIQEKLAAKLGQDAVDTLRGRAARGILKHGDLRRTFKALEDMGYHGWLEEMGEERYGGFLRGLTGLRTDRTGKAGLENALRTAIPSWDELIVEGISFAAPGAAAVGIHHGQLAAAGINASDYTRALDTVMRGTGAAFDADGKQRFVEASQDRLYDSRGRDLPSLEEMSDAMTYLAEVADKRPEGTLPQMLDGFLGFLEGVVTLQFAGHPRYADASVHLGRQGKAHLMHAYQTMRHGVQMQLETKGMDSAEAKARAKKLAKAETIRLMQSYRKTLAVQKDIYEDAGVMDLVAELEGLDPEASEERAAELQEQIVTRLNDAATRDDGPLSFIADTDPAGNEVRMFYRRGSLDPITQDSMALREAMERTLGRHGLRAQEIVVPDSGQIQDSQIAGVTVSADELDSLIDDPDAVYSGYLGWSIGGAMSATMPRGEQPYWSLSVPGGADRIRNRLRRLREHQRRGDLGLVFEGKADTTQDNYSPRVELVHIGRGRVHARGAAETDAPEAIRQKSDLLAQEINTKATTGNIDMAQAKRILADRGFEVMTRPDIKLTYGMELTHANPETLLQSINVAGGLERITDEADRAKQARTTLKSYGGRQSADGLWHLGVAALNNEDHLHVGMASGYHTWEDILERRMRLRGTDLGDPALTEYLSGLAAFAEAVRKGNAEVEGVDLADAATRKDIKFILNQLQQRTTDAPVKVLGQGFLGWEYDPSIPAGALLASLVRAFESWAAVPDAPTLRKNFVTRMLQEVGLWDEQKGTIDLDELQDHLGSENIMDFQRRQAQTQVLKALLDTPLTGVPRPVATEPLSQGTPPSEETLEEKAPAKEPVKKMPAEKAEAVDTVYGDLSAREAAKLDRKQYDNWEYQAGESPEGMARSAEAREIRDDFNVAGVRRVLGRAQEALRSPATPKEIMDRAAEQGEPISEKEASRISANIDAHNQKVEAAIARIEAVIERMTSPTVEAAAEPAKSQKELTTKEQRRFEHFRSLGFSEEAALQAVEGERLRRASLTAEPPAEEETVPSFPDTAAAKAAIEGVAQETRRAASQNLGGPPRKVSLDRLADLFGGEQTTASVAEISPDVFNAWVEEVPTTQRSNIDLVAQHIAQRHREEIAPEALSSLKAHLDRYAEDAAAHYQLPDDQKALIASLGPNEAQNFERLVEDFVDSQNIGDEARQQAQDPGTLEDEVAASLAEDVAEVEFTGDVDLREQFHSNARAVAAINTGRHFAALMHALTGMPGYAALVDTIKHPTFGPVLEEALQSVETMVDFIHRTERGQTPELTALKASISKASEVAVAKYGDAGVGVSLDYMKKVVTNMRSMNPTYTGVMDTQGEFLPQNIVPPDIDQARARAEERRDSFMASPSLMRGVIDAYERLLQVTDSGGRPWLDVASVDQAPNAETRKAKAAALVARMETAFTHPEFAGPAAEFLNALTGTPSGTIRRAAATAQGRRALAETFAHPIRYHFAYGGRARRRLLHPTNGPSNISKAINDIWVGTHNKELDQLRAKLDTAKTLRQRRQIEQKIARTEQDALSEDVALAEARARRAIDNMSKVLRWASNESPTLAPTVRGRANKTYAAYQQDNLWLRGATEFLARFGAGMTLNNGGVVYINEVRVNSRTVVPFEDLNASDKLHVVRQALNHGYLYTGVYGDKNNAAFVRIPDMSLKQMLDSYRQFYEAPGRLWIEQALMRRPANMVDEHLDTLERLAKRGDPEAETLRAEMIYEFLLPQFDQFVEGGVLAYIDEPKSAKAGERVADFQELFSNTVGENGNLPADWIDTHPKARKFLAQTLRTRGKRRGNDLTGGPSFEQVEPYMERLTGRRHFRTLVVENPTLEDNTDGMTVYANAVGYAAGQAFGADYLKLRDVDTSTSLKVQLSGIRESAKYLDKNNAVNVEALIGQDPFWRTVADFMADNQIDFLVFRNNEKVPTAYAREHKLVPDDTFKGLSLDGVAEGVTPEAVNALVRETPGRDIIMPQVLEGRERTREARLSKQMNNIMSTSLGDLLRPTLNRYVDLVTSELPSNPEDMVERAIIDFKARDLGHLAKYLETAGADGLRNPTVRRQLGLGWALRVLQPQAGLRGIYQNIPDVRGDMSEPPIGQSAPAWINMDSEGVHPNTVLENATSESSALLDFTSLWRDEFVRRNPNITSSELANPNQLGIDRPGLKIPFEWVFQIATGDGRAAAPNEIAWEMRTVDGIETPWIPALEPIIPMVGGTLDIRADTLTPNALVQNEDGKYVIRGTDFFSHRTPAEAEVSGGAAYLAGGFSRPGNLGRIPQSQHLKRSGDFDGDTTYVYASTGETGATAQGLRNRIVRGLIHGFRDVPEIRNWAEQDMDVAFQLVAEVGEERIAQETQTTELAYNTLARLSQEMEMAPRGQQVIGVAAKMNSTMRRAIEWGAHTSGREIQIPLASGAPFRVGRTPEQATQAAVSGSLEWHRANLALLSGPQAMVTVSADDAKHWQLGPLGMTPWRLAMFVTAAGMNTEVFQRDAVEYGPDKATFQRAFEAEWDALKPRVQALLKTMADSEFLDAVDQRAQADETRFGGAGRYKRADIRELMFQEAARRLSQDPQRKAEFAEAASEGNRAANSFILGTEYGAWIQLHDLAESFRTLGVLVDAEVGDPQMRSMADVDRLDSVMGVVRERRGPTPSLTLEFGSPTVAEKMRAAMDKPLDDAFLSNTESGRVVREIAADSKAAGKVTAEALEQQHVTLQNILAHRLAAQDAKANPMFSMERWSQIRQEYEDNAFISLLRPSGQLDGGLELLPMFSGEDGAVLSEGHILRAQHAFDLLPESLQLDIAMAAAAGFAPGSSARVHSFVELMGRPDSKFRAKMAKYEARAWDMIKQNHRPAAVLAGVMAEQTQVARARAELANVAFGAKFRSLQDVVEDQDSAATGDEVLDKKPFVQALREAGFLPEGPVTRGRLFEELITGEAEVEREVSATATDTVTVLEPKSNLPANIKAKERAKFTVPADARWVLVADAGAEGSSTAGYMGQAASTGNLINEDTTFQPGDIVLTSSEGTRRDRYSPVNAAGNLRAPYNRLVEALEAGAVVRTDARVTKFNVGEGELRKALADLGYQETKVGQYSEWRAVETKAKEPDADIKFARRDGLVPTVEQGAALDTIAKFLVDREASASELVGYAGTGKTTLVENIVRHAWYLDPRRNVRVWAPTNKAARVLQSKLSSSGVVVAAETIHAGLYGEPDPITGDWNPHGVDQGALIIVDEASMLTEDVYTDLVDVVRQANAQILFIGDNYQLEPVGKPSFVLHPTKSPVSSKYRAELSEVMRQAAGSDVLVTATYIRNTDTAAMPQGAGSDSFRVFGSRSNFVRAYQRVMADLSADAVMITATNSSRMGYNQMARQARYGADAKNQLNGGEVLISVANSAAAANSELVSLAAAPSQPPMRIKLNVEVGSGQYAKNVSVEIFRHELQLRVGDEQTTEIVYFIPGLKLPSLYHGQLVKAMPDTLFEELMVLGDTFETPRGVRKLSRGVVVATYGYAMTAHKSQGSQWDTVFVDQNYVAPSWNAGRWFYTAITRATDNVRTVAQAVHTRFDLEEARRKLTANAPKLLPPQTTSPKAPTGEISDVETAVQEPATTAQEQAPKPLPQSFIAQGRSGLPVRVYRDPVVGWMAQEGATASPISDTQAQRYFERRAEAQAPLSQEQAARIVGESTVPKRVTRSTASVATPTEETTASLAPVNLRALAAAGLVAGATLENPQRVLAAQSPDQVQMTASNALRNRIFSQEGYNLSPYDDRGTLAIGPGVRLFTDRKTELTNLLGKTWSELRDSKTELTDQEYNKLLDWATSRAWESAAKTPGFSNLHPNQQVALADLHHWGVLPRQFKAAQAAIEVGDMDLAAFELRDSKAWRHSRGQRGRLEAAARTFETRFNEKGAPYVPPLYERIGTREQLVKHIIYDQAWGDEFYGQEAAFKAHRAKVAATWNESLKSYMKAETLEEAEHALDQIWHRIHKLPEGQVRALFHWAQHHLPASKTPAQQDARYLAPDQSVFDPNQEVKTEAIGYEPGQITASVAGSDSGLLFDMVSPFLAGDASQVREALVRGKSEIAALLGREQRDFVRRTNMIALDGKIRPYVQRTLRVSDDGTRILDDGTKAYSGEMLFSNIRGVETLTPDEHKTALLLDQAAHHAIQNTRYDSEGRRRYSEDAREHRVILGVPLDGGLETLQRVLPDELARELYSRKVQAEQEVDQMINAVKDQKRRARLQMSKAERVAKKMAQNGAAIYSEIEDTDAEGNLVTRFAGGHYTLPVGRVEDFLEQTATKGSKNQYKAKLIKAGRDAKDITVAALVNDIAENGYEYTFREISRIAPWMLSQDSQFLRYRTNYAPQYYGLGYLGPEERVAFAAVLQDISGLERKATERYEGLVELAKESGGAPRPIEDASDRLLKFLFSVKGLEFRSREDALEQIHSDALAETHNLFDGMTYVDAASELYKETMNRLTERKLLGQEMDQAVGDIRSPLALAKTLEKTVPKFKDREYSGRQLARRYPTFEEAYRRARLRPRGIGATQAMHRYAADILMAAETQIILNEMVMTVDGTGVNLVIPDPDLEFADAEQVISKPTWTALAQRLAAQYDQKFAPGQNPKEFIKHIIDTKVSNDPRYTEVKKAPYPSVPRFWTFNAGTKEQVALNKLVGGEIAGYLKHVMSAPTQDPYKVLEKLTHVNNWMKMMAMQASLFFPMAGQESLTALSGGKYWTQGGPKSQIQLRRMLKSNHPYFANLMERYTRLGFQFSSTSSPVDLPHTMIDKDIQFLQEFVSRHFNTRVGEGVGWLARLPLRQTSMMFESYFNTAKLWSIWHMENKARRAAEAKNQPFDGDAYLRNMSHYLNPEVGGVDFNTMAWATPEFRRNMQLLLFSPNWTLSAINAAGFGMFTQPLLGNYVTPQESRHIAFKRWPTMAIVVMFLWPQVVQAMAYGAAAAAGGLDDDDEFWMLKNEEGNELRADITPLMRMMPWYEGEPTGERRVYVRWGKQAFETKRWLESPWKALLSKSSQITRWGLEMATGNAVGIDWQLEFKDQGLLGWIQDRDGRFGGSRLGYTIKKFMPFSILSWAQHSDAVPVQFLGVTSRGISQTRATQAFQGLLESWANEKTYAKIYDNPRVKSNLKALGWEILSAAERNGYDPQKVLHSARGAVLRDAYAKLYRALDRNDQKEMDRQARRVVRLHGTIRGVLSSVRNRNRMLGKPDPLTPDQAKMIREVFAKP